MNFDFASFINWHLEVISAGEAAGQQRGIKTASDRLFNTFGKPHLAVNAKSSYLGFPVAVQATIRE